MDENAILRAVCEIKGPATEGEKIYKGQGVFISPGHVLTALHVAEGIKLRELSIKAANGEQSAIAMGSKWNLGNPALDLAILSLRRPISDDFAIVASSSLPKDEDVKGYLVTKFENVNACHEVSLSGFDRWMKFPNQWGQHLVKYESAFVATAGHSGSPIVDRHGRVISVLSASLEDAWSPAFLAPDPNHLAQFFSEYYLDRKFF